MSTNKGGAQGERAAEEVKGGVKGLHNLTEGIRHNVNAFADDLIGGNKTHKSTGFSSDAKLAGKEIEHKIGGEKPATTPHTTPAGTNPAGSHADNTTSSAKAPL
ncbi:hypothetical protein Slin15195_G036610 [Septoria linicola]|uniref:Uncharacterized protein n=1 Tax=Septoria linicola TaxID=215465 RepID=A0A9Q9EHV0_9PEZI|nr:hypothetical protein Slin15195_G036610 [Septoria linicola]